MSPEELQRTIAKSVWLIAGVGVMFWFLDVAIVGLLFGLLVFVLATALAAPITWLERRGAKRWFASLVVCLGCTGVVVALSWLIFPRLAEQAGELASALPDYTAELQKRVSAELENYPALREQLPQTSDSWIETAGPVLSGFASRIGRYSLNMIGLLIGALLLVTTVVYAAISPRPIVRGLIRVFPVEKQERAARSLVEGSQVIVGWVWSNVIIGGIEAVAVGLFLSWLGIPGALVWAALTFFAELVPKLGAYLMALPPILVALAIDPMDALWVAVFFVVIQWVAGDLIGPAVRANHMRLHAVSVIVATVMMGAAFGLLGAVLATPLVGIAKAFYNNFYHAKQVEKIDVDLWVERVLDRDDEPDRREAAKE